MYAMIRQAINIGCGITFLLPDIDHETKVPDFFTVMVPPQNHSFYLSILGSYKTISNLLLTFFLHPDIVSDSDGFVYLATILHRLLPQFGGRPLKLLDEVAKLYPIEGEDLLDFHKRALSIEASLTLSRMAVPPTLFFQHYLDQLNKCEETSTHLATYNRKFAKHQRHIGDNIPFHEIFQDVYDLYLRVNAYAPSNSKQESHQQLFHQPAMPMQTATDVTVVIDTMTMLLFSELLLIPE